MTAYRLEVRAAYPATQGVPTDIAAQAATAVQAGDMEVLHVSARRARGTDLVCVALSFDAPDDETARALMRSLPREVTLSNYVEADHLRTGTGRSWRHLR